MSGRADFTAKHVPFTKNGSNQILILLTNTDAQHDVSSAVSRVSKNWENFDASAEFWFSYEWIVLDK